MMSEWRGLVSFFFLFLSFSLSFFLTSRSAVGWWDVGWRGVERKGRRYVGMYVCVCMYVRWLPVFFIIIIIFFSSHSLSLSLSLPLSPLSPSAEERLDWRLGGSDRGYSKRCQTVQALARDFRLGPAGGGWDRQ